MTKKKNITSDFFIGLRISKAHKLKIIKYARENDFSVGELMTIATLLHIGEKTEAGKLLIKHSVKNK